MAKMERDGIEEEELLAIAEKIGFKIESDDDLIRLFREADKLGFWPELHRPKLDTTGKNIVPHPQDPTRRFFPKWEHMEVPPGCYLVMTKKGPKIEGKPLSQEVLDARAEETKLLKELRLLTEKTNKLAELAPDVDLDEKEDDDLDDWLDKL